MLTIDPSSPAVTPPLSKPALTRFLNRARAAVGLVGTVEVLLTTDGELKRLNRRWRNKNKATDVLSFPAFVPEGFPVSAETHAGDLAISIETASRQAAAFGHTLADELRVLLLHGLLHLFGLDHEQDSGEMAAREAELRAELGLPNSLIARVEGPVAKPRAHGSAPARSEKKTAVGSAKRSAIARGRKAAGTSIKKAAGKKAAAKAGSKTAAKAGRKTAARRSR